MFRLTGQVEGVFIALAAALVVFAVINAAAVYLGAWFPSRK